jgi:hypothetical protein
MIWFLGILLGIAFLAGLLKLTIGLPIFGGLVPYVGRRRLALNKDGSFVDTGLNDIVNEVGYYYVEPVVLEWLNMGVPLTAAHVHLTATGEIVEPTFAVAGAEVGQ